MLYDFFLHMYTVAIVDPIHMCIIIVNATCAWRFFSF